MSGRDGPTASGFSRVAIYDTSIGSPNLGDQIIMESVNAEVERLFPGAFVYRIPTHDRLGKYGRRILRKADIVIAGGTNLLFSYWSKLRPWRLGPADLFAAGRKCVLMGTGWSTYLDAPSLPVRLAFRQLLSPTALHAVRDGYSARHLAEANIANVLNTGCPTLWRLTPDRLAAVPGQKGHGVVTTITDYARSPEADRMMLKTLLDSYATVYFWPQGAGDLDYLRALDVAGLTMLRSSLSHFDALLAETPGIDYVGTRLHGGIRALQHGRRSLVVSVDNRAREMGGDFRLPILERDDIAGLAGRIEGGIGLEVALPQEAIARWRGQFSRPGHETQAP